MSGRTYHKRARHGAHVTPERAVRRYRSVRDSVPPATLLDLADRVLYRAGQDWGAALRHLTLIVAAAAAVYVVTSRWTATIGTGITAGVVAVSRYALQRLRRPVR